MTDLTKSKDLLAEPRVIAAYQSLMGYTGTMMIPPSHCIEKVAWEMRDACVKAELPFVGQLMHVTGEHYPSTQYVMVGMLRKSRPSRWIIAATLAWEAGQ